MRRILALFMLLALVSAGTLPVAAQGGGSRPPITPENAGLVRQLARLGHGMDLVRGVAWSPDGKIIAIGGQTYIRLYSAGDLEADPALLKGSEWNMPWGVAFSPDGKLLASSSDGIRLWDVKTGKTRAILDETGGALSVAFSPDGKLLASGGGDNTVRLWDVQVQTGFPRATLQGHTYWVWSVAFSPDGKLLASGGDHTVRLWDVQSGQPKAALSGNTSVSSVAFNPDGKLLASGGDQSVRLWDVQSGQSKIVLENRSASVYSVAFSPDGSLLASAGDNKKVVLCDVKTGQIIATLEGHTDYVRNVAFSPDGSLLASTDDYSVHLWGIPVPVSGATAAAAS